MERKFQKCHTHNEACKHNEQPIPIPPCEHSIDTICNITHQSGTNCVTFKHEFYVKGQEPNLDSKHLISNSRVANTKLKRLASSPLHPACSTTSRKLDCSDASSGIDSDANASADSRPFGWRLSYLPQTECWNGWLLKRSRGTIARWQRRWFELRRQPPPFLTKSRGSTKYAAVIYYSHHQIQSETHCKEHRPAGHKRLDVIGVRREPSLDCASGAALSVDAAGRVGRILLMAASAAEAEAVVWLMERRLLAASCLTHAPPAQLLVSADSSAGYHQPYPSSFEPLSWRYPLVHRPLTAAESPCKQGRSAGKNKAATAQAGLSC
jgi:hypothetical protein